MKNNKIIKILAIIGTILSLPLLVVKAILRVPNIQINYKSGIKKKVFVTEINYLKENGKLTEITWSFSGLNEIFYLNVDEIESIYQLW